MMLFLGLSAIGLGIYLGFRRLAEAVEEVGEVGLNRGPSLFEKMGSEAAKLVGKKPMAEIIKRGEPVDEFLDEHGTDKH